MSEESLCVKAPKAHGERLIILASKMRLLNKELKIQKDTNFIYVPLVRKPKDDELKIFKEQFLDWELSSYIFPQRKGPAATITELLKDKLEPRLLDSLPRAIDFVGDIAIIEISPELDTYKNVVGEAILKTSKNVHTVLAKSGTISGTYRLRHFSVIGGRHKTETLHKEHGCQYQVDLAKVYFSPRLSYEHYRVASLVKEGETVVDLFAGVGPFAILIAKTHENVKVYALDVNPHAVEYLSKNVKLNRVEGKVHPILGDSREIVERRLSGVADRVIMNLPEKAIDFVDVSCEAINPTGGIVHFYSFVGLSDKEAYAESRFIDAVEKSGCIVQRIIFSRPVRDIAPYKWQAVLDAKIAKPPRSE